MGELIDRFASRYTNLGASHRYRAELSALFAFASVTHSRQLSDAAVNQWATVNQWVARARAKNSRRGQLTRACVFLRWCVRHDLADPVRVEELRSRENPLRSTPPLHGKPQGKYPARWLTYEEAYGARFF